MKVFLVFDVGVDDSFGDYFPWTMRHVEGTSYVVIDNDSSPELGPTLRSIAGTLNDTDEGKVHRISKTPHWKIVEDVLIGQAAAGSNEPTVISVASDARINQQTPLVVDALLGPVGDVREDFVYASNPVELMAAVMAKTKGWGGVSPFAPSAFVPSRVQRESTRLVPPLGNLATLFGVDRPVIDAEVAPWPPAIHPALVAFYREHLGPEASAFVVSLQTASQIADDFVDDALPGHLRSSSMCELLEILLLEVPHDPFYQKHQQALEPVVAQCVSVWHLSNALTVDTTPESRLWCYVQREAFQMVVWRTAVIVGGLAHGRLVLQGFQQLLHGPDGGAKKFPAWLEETRARAGRG